MDSDSEPGFDSDHGSEYDSDSDSDLDSDLDSNEDSEMESESRFWFQIGSNRIGLSRIELDRVESSLWKLTGAPPFFPSPVLGSNSI